MSFNFERATAKASKLSVLNPMIHVKFFKHFFGGNANYSNERRDLNNGRQFFYFG